MTRGRLSSSPSVERCPACGHPLEELNQSACGLCGLALREESITGDDVTPYAVAFANDSPGWRRMCDWIWYASFGRLKHLALMRSSAASRHFTRFNVYLLAVGLAILQGTRVGWQRVTNSPTLEPTGSIEPAHPGWLQIAQAPHSIRGKLAADDYVVLWWNPAEAVIAMATAAAATLILGWILLTLMRLGVKLAHARRYRGEGRMTAAVHYATAWTIPVALAAAIVGLRPISFFGSMVRWRWYPPDRVFLITAAVLAGFAAVMGWFWLIRLGSTAPARTRFRVVTFFVLGAPILGAAAVGAWWLGLDAAYPALFDAMKLSF